MSFDSQFVEVTFFKYKENKKHKMYYVVLYMC